MAPWLLIALLVLPAAAFAPASSFAHQLPLRATLGQQALDMPGAAAQLGHVSASSTLLVAENEMYLPFMTGTVIAASIVFYIVVVFVAPGQYLANRKRPKDQLDEEAPVRKGVKNTKPKKKR
ncbi:hypothetical protein M885DRAFT_521057, partial [Pelagophyceae sp. CCMP2097]